MDSEELIARLQRTAADLGGRVTRAEFCRRAGVTRPMIERHFASYRALARAAGQPSWHEGMRIPHDALMRALRDAFKAEGPSLSMQRATRLSGHCITTYINRWGRWRDILAAFIAWAECEDPTFVHLDVLRCRCEQSSIRPRPERLSGDPRRFGELLRFRTLEYAPTDESGVIYLFGLVSADLGFVVDGLSKAFPDAEAKRRVGKQWRRVRIEFEYESRNFRIHGHDPQGCDLIVCWSDNWPECPVEVLELRSAIPGLRDPAPPPAQASS